MSGAVQAGYAPPTGPDQPAPGRRRLRWLLAATVAWAVLLAVLTWISVRDDPPTVREQRSLAEAGPVVDRAVGELLAAAGDGGAAWLVPDVLRRGCRVTPFADGAALTRGVEVLLADDDARGLLQRVADRLPADWRAGVRVTGEGPVLRADAGEFVAVEGRSTGSGRVRLTAETGCRPVGAGYRAPTADGGSEAAMVTELLGGFGGAAGPVEVSAAPCPDGATARTATAVSAPDRPDRPTLPGALSRFSDGTLQVRATTELYAYRSSRTVVAERVDGRVRLTVAAICRR
ncbi:hypothetical protein U2F26_01405 [Micromonospora sp. 4G57]|uniref:Uncharacterized protein n=1 Tax=Micromonospora sicca TaxID=2202420 RepID=A0ABU5JMH8_9ACTN|nr:MULTISPECIES: hypothetical protein [unclassified Micromonospora]MDZ5441390.1 hypothetical protein [Micromonospora sp. 4G57]MDZ5493823.1 hypothetical protein [Micromonospora sp. 4G53]